VGERKTSQSYLEYNATEAKKCRTEIFLPLTRTRGRKVLNDQMEKAGDSKSFWVILEESEGKCLVAGTISPDVSLRKEPKIVNNFDWEQTWEGGKRK